VTEVAELSRALGRAGEAVHARIEVQRQLQAVTANATVALFMTDANHLCTFMNPAAERLTGFTFSEVEGRTLHEVVHRSGEKAMHSFAECCFSRAFVADTTWHGHDVLMHKDGHLCDVAYAASPLLGAGVALGSVVEVRDVTIEKTLEAARRTLLENEQRARSEAEASNRAKDEFLAMLGHELRNPLAAITNASHLLGHRRSDQLAQAREVIQRQSAHLARLVDDLLDAARVASGKIVLALGPVDLGEVVSRALATLNASGRTHRHRISLNLEPTWVLGDETRLEQIVTNLATNALRYTPAGGHIEFGLTADGNDAVLSVTDSGIGIPAAMLPNVFDLFVQGDRGLERAHGGLGIGLTLVKRLTELHGGTAQAASDGVDLGSTFTIRLPCISAPTTQRQSMLPLNRTSEERRVLLIEDNADARAMLRTILEVAGHVVTERPDGPSGLTAALNMRPDVALIDIGLPGLNGYDVARGIRDAVTDHPIRLIAISGYGQPQDRVQALEAGFDAHLVKPVEPETVLREVAITSHVPHNGR
jgi:PAS domain S-box-containing protein